MKLVLITGDSGFIGSALTKRMRGLYITAGMDIKTSEDEDIVCYENVDETKWDVIVHCAALVSVPKSIEDPVGYTRVNVLGTVNMLKHHPEAKFVYLNTSCMYGEGMGHTEESPQVPESIYALTKMAGEESIKLMSKNWLSLRLGNVVGPGQRGEPNVYQIFERDKELTIYGDGTQTRDFVELDVVCEAVVRGIEKDLTGVFNIGSGVSKSVLEVANEFNKPRRFAPARTGELHTFGMSVEKARKARLI